MYWVWVRCPQYLYKDYVPGVGKVPQYLYKDYALGVGMFKTF